MSTDIANQQVMKLFGVSMSVTVQDEPVLIGYLNRSFGYNGVNKIEIGTPVYSFKDYYYFEMTSINGNINMQQKFYKETLKHCINFID